MSLAHPAARYGLGHGPVAEIMSAVKSNSKGHAAVGDGGERLLEPVELKRQRLFTEDRLPSPCRAGDQLYMGGRGRADCDGLDIAVAKELVGGRGDGDAQLATDGVGRGSVCVADRDQRCLSNPVGKQGRVEATDPPHSDHGNSHRVEPTMAPSAAASAIRWPPADPGGRARRRGNPTRLACDAPLNAIEPRRAAERNTSGLQSHV